MVLADALEDVEEAESEPIYPPVVLQVQNNMLKFPNCVVLTRVGNFYEVRLRSSLEHLTKTSLTWIAIS